MTWRSLLTLLTIAMLFGLGGCASNQDLGTSDNKRWQPEKEFPWTTCAPAIWCFLI